MSDGSIQSALYVGSLRHRRFAPAPHAFEYRLCMAWLDLAELDRVFRGRWFWSTRRPALAWLRRADYLGDARLPLDQAVRERVALETGVRPAGPVRMLTHLRTFGACFNPVTFYFCYDLSGDNVETIVAEITNTPWNERHAYVLPAGAGGEVAISLRKAIPRLAVHAHGHRVRLALLPPGPAARRSHGESARRREAVRRDARARAAGVERREPGGRPAALSLRIACECSPRSTGRRCGCGRSACPSTSTPQRQSRNKPA